MKKYDWLRFWGPRDGKFLVNSYGALEDPRGPYGHVLNPTAKTLEELQNIHCLVLLGEPGTGKSEELKHAVNRANADSNGIVLPFQLRDYHGDLTLRADVFENATVKTWVEGVHNLYLYLDSLDEGLLAVSTLANILGQQLTKLPADRLFVRIACRTAEWPAVLEERLRSHWGDQAFGAYELLPLREKEIRQAVRAEGIDEASFFEELDRKRAGPLAIKPVTLVFLLKRFSGHGDLPNTQAELYAEGCKYLCEESNKSRIAARQKGSLSTNQRVQVAQRIAAISIFSNRSAVWMGVTGDLPEGDCRIEEMASGTEGLADDRFHVGENEIRETLGTGLFNSRGAERIGWAHQTYAEFLAARYLTENVMSLDQRIAVICGNDDKVIPQLHETAAWLASMDREVFQRIMRADPVILLRSDVAAADDTSKASIVEALLASADNEEWIDRDWSLHASYSKLNHPGLSEQLRRYITDNRKSYFARRIATDIAEWCDVGVLQDELVRLALNASDDIHLRVNAAYAVNRIADSQSKAKLRPLAFGEAGDDPADELKGCGLRAIWPDHISSEQLFSLLTWPKRSNLHGSYRGFLNALANEVDKLDLVAALRWLREADVHADPVSPFSELRNEVLQRAWQRLDITEIADSLADLIVNHARKLRGDEDEKFVIEDNSRRQLLGSVIRRLAASDKPTPWYFLVYDNQLVNASDVPWLIGQIRVEQSPQAQLLLSDIIGHVLDWHNTKHVQLIIEASANSPLLADTFRSFLSPVYLDSEQAAAQRKFYAESQGWNNKKTEEPSLNPPAKVRVCDLLKQFETGDVDAWWRLNHAMMLHSNGNYGHFS